MLMEYTYDHKHYEDDYTLIVFIQQGTCRRPRIIKLLIF